MTCAKTIAINSRRKLPYILLWLSCLVIAVAPAGAQQSATVHHDLDVRLTPDSAGLEVKDRITLPKAVDGFSFLLHQDLQPEALTPGARMRGGRGYSGAVPVREWEVRFDRPSDQITLEYRGRIHHPLETHSQNYAGGRSSTPGSISEKGVFLSASSYWFPVVPDRLLSFSMRTRLPDGWSAISQGQALEGDAGWYEASPQDDIYLVAGRYHRYQQDAGSVLAEVYLRTPDPQTAARYLTVTDEYLQRYKRLIGPYPYAKFALVENFWESGYGMPSFTLLGPKVIRLPFILHTSYPHEILHNWWGNGVYIDYSGGNWCEGLTAYLADHLNKELRGEGADYRRDTLQKYADYVAQEKDFPLTEFRGNHGAVSQAVGYGKTLMFMHMLRRQIGDRQFVDGLRRFYKRNLFRSASFDDLKRAFEAAGSVDLEHEFEQWTQRPGAPKLSLDQVDVQQIPSGYRLKARLRQQQPGAAFDLQVPLFIQLQGRSTALEQTLPMSGKEARIDIELQRRPLRLSIDPRFDLFRRLEPSEIPSALGQLFGADRPTIVLPGSAAREAREQYLRLAERWSERQSGIRVVWDQQLQRLPDDGPLWLFGSENLFREYFSEQLDGTEARLTTDSLTLGDQIYPFARYSFALVAADGVARSRPLGLLALDSPDSMPALARKLPHYSKYSYLVFEGGQARNRLKGQWQINDSALTVEVGKDTDIPPLQIPRRPALISPRS